MVNKRWAEQVGVGFKYELASMEGERVYATTQNVIADSQRIDVKIIDTLAPEPETSVEITSVDLNKDKPEVIDW